MSDAGNSPLWRVTDMAQAMNAQRAGDLPGAITGISIDTRTIGAGEAYFAIKGDVHDGHDFVGKALEAGAGLAVIDEAHRGQFGNDARLLVVADVLEGLIALGRAARARTQARVIAVTGSVGKTSTKEALRLVLGAQGKTHASVASFNNHWGVPLTLARCPQDAQFAIFEIGMNHAGEITPLTKMVRPHIAIITTVEPVHLEAFGSINAIADAKAEIFAGLEPDGVAILNHDNAQFERLVASARAQGVARIVSFGSHEASDACLMEVALHSECSAARARILGQDITYKVSMPGRHVVMNSLAVLAASVLAGGDLAMSALSLARMAPPPGRGGRVRLNIHGRKATMIDESYNANPASMRAALAVLGKIEPGKKGRRIAVLGDMLELGPTSPDLHRGLAQAVREHHTDLVYCCGPLMRDLWEALPDAQRGAYAIGAAQLEADVVAAIQPGDVVMIKGSNGSRMKIIVHALEKHFPPQDAGDDAAE